MATGQALLLAGHETTAGFIAMMTAHLLADRRRWERLLADPSLVRTAVEEVLRFDPNGSGFGMLRYVHEDTELSGGVVPAAPPWCAAWPRPTATRARGRARTSWTWAAAPTRTSRSA
ncbi:hypothetical protein NKH77_42010 [Streptomyces sp. M19]